MGLRAGPRVGIAATLPAVACGSNNVHAGPPGATRTLAGESDHADGSQNHTDGGTTSALVGFADGFWDAVCFDRGSNIDLSTRTHVVFWVMPTDRDVQFRPRFRRAEPSSDVTVNGSPIWFAEGWQVGEWQRVVVPLEDFDFASDVDSLYFRAASDSNPPERQYYLDDIQIVTATVG